MHVPALQRKLHASTRHCAILLGSTCTGRLPGSCALPRPSYASHSNDACRAAGSAAHLPPHVIVTRVVPLAAHLGARSRGSLEHNMEACHPQNNLADAALLLQCSLGI